MSGFNTDPSPTESTTSAIIHFPASRKNGQGSKLQFHTLITRRPAGRPSDLVNLNDPLIEGNLTVQEAAHPSSLGKASEIELMQSWGIAESIYIGSLPSVPFTPTTKYKYMKALEDNT